MQRCTRCVLSERFSNIAFDERGVCSVCHEWDATIAQVDFDEREREFRALVEEARARKGRYDLVLGFSGGKDSIYALYLLKRRYSANPLLAYYHNGYQGPRAQELMFQAADRFDCDLVVFRPGQQQASAILRAQFLAIGDVCVHCDLEIYSLMHRLARQHGVGLVATGGGSTEGYTSATAHPELDFFRYAKGAYGECEGVDFGRLELTERDCAEVKLAPMANYFRWDYGQIFSVVTDELGIDLPRGSDLDRIHYDCRLCSLTDHIRFRKRGFSRYEHNFAAMVRSGHMQREEALRLLGLDAERSTREPEVLAGFCRRIGVSRAEFDAVVDDPEIAYRPPWYHGES